MRFDDEIEEVEETDAIVCGSEEAAAEISDCDYGIEDNLEILESDVIGTSDRYEEARDEIDSIFAHIFPEPESHCVNMSDNTGGSLPAALRKYVSLYTGVYSMSTIALQYISA